MRSVAHTDGTPLSFFLGGIQSSRLRASSALRSKETIKRRVGMGMGRSVWMLLGHFASPHLATGKSTPPKVAAAGKSTRPKVAAAAARIGGWTSGLPPSCI